MRVQLTQVPKDLLIDYPDLICRLPNPKNARFRDLTGATYEHARVIGFVGFLKQYSVWLCECKCGVQFLLRGNSIGRERELTCGCLYANVSYTLEYKAWLSIMKTPEWVCENWHRFRTFFKEMGECNEELRWIVRFERLEPYWLENCRWGNREDNLVTSPQNNYRRITVNGITKIMSHWADVVGVSRERMRQRVDLCESLGADPAEAVTTPKGETLPCVLKNQKVSV